MTDCIRHQMADGTIMDGPIHGPNQICIEYKSNNRRDKMPRHQRPTRRQRVARTAQPTQNGVARTSRRRVRPTQNGVARTSRRRVRPSGRVTNTLQRGVSSRRRFQTGGNPVGNRSGIIRQGNKQFRCPNGSSTITADCIEIIRPDYRG